MKKLVALLLTILLISTIVGCRQEEDLYDPATPIAGDESSENGDELASESELGADEEEEADSEDEEEADDEADDEDEEEADDENEAASANGNENGIESGVDPLAERVDDYMCEEYIDTFYEDDPWGYYSDLLDDLEDELWYALDELFDRIWDRIDSLGEQEGQIEALEDRAERFEEEIYDLMDILFEQRDEERITVQEFETRMRELIERIRNFQL